MRKGYVSRFVYAYSGPWPQTLFNHAFIVLAGPLASNLVSSDPFSWRPFLYTGLLSVGLFLVAVKVKRSRAYREQQQDL